MFPAEPVREFSSEARLRALLEEDRVCEIPATRGGKISRAHYAQRLGCARSALTRFVHVFEEYETELGIVTGPMRPLQEMRAWLLSAYIAKSLDFNVSKGKLDRKAFEKRFELRGGTYMVRYPAIRALIEDFDARAKRENYRESIHQIHWDGFVAALAGELPLNQYPFLQPYLVQWGQLMNQGNDALFGGCRRGLEASHCAASHRRCCSWRTCESS